MKVEIINKSFSLDIYGFSRPAINKDYAETALQLMDKMWQTVNAEKLKHKGINIWVFGLNEEVFSGVELYDPPNQHTELAHKTIKLTRYGYYKHVGPYNLIKQAGQNMRDELKDKGFDIYFPYIEIYGHWTDDESKLETELLVCVK